MKRSLCLALVVLLVGSALAGASNLISKQQAEQDALNAVGGGTVTLAHKEKELGKIIWSVDITGASNEFEVWVDAHSGAILQILTQPLGPQAGFISQQQAEQAALTAAGGGTVVQAQRDQWKGYQIWDVAITQPGLEYDVFVNARNAAILKVAKHIDQGASRQYISKARAEQIALNAVGGGKVLLAKLETNDKPVDWSVDVQAANGKEYEVKVNAYTGKVIAIIGG
ncbi:MAG: PepSY domain-containing protein [Acidobacteriia bacterium]|nr:PepSY domain-containing protein [Terriglobia bacterium]